MKVRCPTCGKETTWTGNPYRPFCSQRCRTLDLARWLTDPDDEDQPPPPAGDSEGGDPVH